VVIRRLRVINERCVGCKICELSCAMLHRNGAFNPSYALIRIESNRIIGLNRPTENIDKPHICRQCEPAPCAEACPVAAFGADERLDIKIINQDECIGCEQCLDACSYGMVRMYEERAIKCDLCNGDPICVRYCPTKALIFDEVEEA